MKMSQYIRIENPLHKQSEKACGIVLDVLELATCDGRFGMLHFALLDPLGLYLESLRFGIVALLNH